MIATDLADLIASLPPLRFVPAAQAPVSDDWCLIAPADDEWCIARRMETGWFHANGMAIGEPLVYATLPAPPGRNSPRMIKILTSWIAGAVDDGDYVSAAKAVDQLADAVRSLRDSPPGRPAG